MKKQNLIATALFLTLFTCVSTMAADETFIKPDFGKRPIPPQGQFTKEQHKEMAKKHMAEFEQKLQLTDAQKEQIKKNQEKSREKMKKIIEQEKKLREEKHKIMEQNRKDFEAILTDEQKETLKKMHEEKIQKMKEMKEKKGQVIPQKPGKPVKYQAK